MSDIKGFITNLGKYNEGELIGEWIDFPISEEDLQEVLQRIGIGSTDSFGQPYEEYFFTDWDLPSGMSWEVFGEYPDIKKVNEVAEAIDRSTYTDDVIGAIFDHFPDIDDAISTLVSGDFMYYPGASDAKSLGEYAVNEIDGGPQYLPKETLEQYFDYEAYGRNMETSGSISYIDSGAIEFY